MAGHAELGSVRKDGFLAGEVQRVASQRSMASFASDIDMRTFAFRGDDVVVAVSAGLATGVDGRPGGDFIEGTGAEMSVLAELRGNDGMANRQESQHQDSRGQRQPDQVFGTLEDSPHSPGKQASATPFFCRATGRVSTPHNSSNAKEFQCVSTLPWE